MEYVSWIPFRSGEILLEGILHQSTRLGYASFKVFIMLPSPTSPESHTATSVSAVSLHRSARADLSYLLIKRKTQTKSCKDLGLRSICSSVSLCN